jgi:hypothetical protein
VGVKPPEPLPPQLAGRAFGVREADSAGVGRGRLRGRDLVTVHRGVRVPADARFTEQLARFAFMARSRTGQVFSHLTAARVWGIPLPTTFSPREGVHVSVRAPTARPRGPGVTGHELTDPHASAVMRFGVPVTDAATTWCHLGLSSATMIWSLLPTISFSLRHGSARAIVARISRSRSCEHASSVITAPERALRAGHS